MSPFASVLQGDRAMKSITLGLGTLAVWAATVVDASAAWNNVFQPTLFHRNRTANCCPPAPAVVRAAPVVAYSAPADPCPQQQCTTNYVQRCFYTPCTTYETRSYYEAVTTMQTSYYYEPVTSYRYSCYYDPCTCSYKQVATPVVTQELRSRCCPVQTWVQRCCQVPVTVMKKSCYLEPQTTCCTTTVGALIPTSCATNGAMPLAGAAPAGPPTISATPSGPPTISTTPPQTPPPPQIKEGTAPSGPNVGNMSYYQQSQWQAPATFRQQSNPTPPNPTPQVKLERIVYGPESFVEGQIVQTDNTPRPNASVLFVSADNGKRETVTANNTGRFQVNLASGNWLVYVQGRDGTAQFHSRLSVQQHQAARITVVN